MATTPTRADRKHVPISIFDGASRRVPESMTACRHRLRQARQRNEFPKLPKKESRPFETSMDF